MAGTSTPPRRTANSPPTRRSRRPAAYRRATAGQPATTASHTPSPLPVNPALPTHPPPPVGRPHATAGRPTAPHRLAGHVSPAARPSGSPAAKPRAPHAAAPPRPVAALQRWQLPLQRGTHQPCGRAAPVAAAGAARAAAAVEEVGTGTHTRGDRRTAGSAAEAPHGARRVDAAHRTGYAPAPPAHPHPTSEPSLSAAGWLWCTAPQAALARWAVSQRSLHRSGAATVSVFHPLPPSEPIAKNIQPMAFVARLPSSTVGRAWVAARHDGRALSLERTLPHEHPPGWFVMHRGVFQLPPMG